MRIALVSQEYPPETGHGGIASQTYLKARGLAALGHDVHVVSHSLDSSRHEHRSGGVHVVRISGDLGEFSTQTESARWITYSSLVAAEVAALDARFGLDVVDFPDWGAEGYVHLLNRTHWQSIPTVVHLHGPIVMFAHALGWPAVESAFYAVGSHMERTCLELADAVFSSSACSARWCETHHGLDATDVEILHMGVDTKIFHPLDLPKEPDPTIVFVGKISATKGAGALVDAALRIARTHPSLRLWLIGRGDEEIVAALTDRAARAGFPDLLRLVGFVPPERLPRYLCRAHVFAAPSVYEGGPGLATLEAMACGLPVVSSTAGGTQEVVRQGESGLLVPPDDLDALEEALRRLLDDEALRSDMGERARAYVAAEADTEGCARRLEGLYERVVRNACSADLPDRTSAVGAP